MKSSLEMRPRLIAWKVEVTNVVHRVCRWSLLPAFLLCAVPGIAQSPVFTDGFEWGDVGEWSLSVPARCDVIRTFDRGLAPIAELHVAVSGNDSTGDGSPGSPFASIGGAVSGAGPGTAIRVHAGTYGGGTYISNVSGEPSAPIWIGGVPVVAPVRSLARRQVSRKCAT